ncbi:MAG: N-acetylmuramoyl-L-alanine amidase [Anaerolineales bacterium]|nr:N-acetylmuramoyl-L-alanine amidase [Anaerolineales bacterium]
MRSQPETPSRRSSAPPVIQFLGQHLPIVIFLVLAFAGMMLVYWYFSPDEMSAEGVTAVSAADNYLAAPIFKNIPAKPVVQRLSQSPGPILVGIISGHRGFDSGAVCSDGLTEAQVNETIADMVLTNLQNQGVRAEKLDEFDARLDNFSGTALVSIHADSCDYINELATGFKISGSAFTDSSPLSICVEQEYYQATQMEYHANTITPDMADYHAFRQIAPSVPAIIIEVGFMNLDREMITTNAQVPATGLTNGILCFLDAYKHSVTAN